jgi:Lrp/AsnC family transcriptional regulator, leucine-responsive regulatory protein
MQHDLDEIDRTILGILGSDGRTTVARIAEQTGLSRPAATDRIARLERRGILRGVTAVTDPAALGQPVTAFVFARVAPGAENGGASVRSLVADDEVVEVHSVAGDDCYLLKVRSASIASLNEFILRLSAPPFSMTTRTTIVMETHFEKIGGIVLTGGDR